MIAAIRAPSIAVWVSTCRGGRGAAGTGADCCGAAGGGGIGEESAQVGGAGGGVVPAFPHDGTAGCWPVAAVYSRSTWAALAGTCSIVASVAGSDHEARGCGSGGTGAGRTWVAPAGPVA